MPDTARRRRPPPGLPDELSPRRLVPPRRTAGRSAVRVGVVAAALLAAAAVAGALVGLVLALVAPHQPRAPARPPAAGPVPSAPSAPGRGGPVVPAARAPGAALPIVGARIVDPGGDEGKKPETVGAAFDGDPATAWTTQRYTTREFGRLKPGVGLLVDLGEPRPVGSVLLTMTAPGAAVELRPADAPVDTPDRLPVAAAASDVPAQATLTPAAPTTARYWLLWITGLTGGSGGYRAGVAELTFRA